jgi:lipopolysaccharide assembly outer membrane protein LptD (OstA)
VKNVSLYFLIACSAVLTFGQTPSVSEVSFRALTVTKDGAITHLKGDVEIAMGRGFILRSEQADYNSNTGEIAARGNVRIMRQGSPIAKHADEAEVNVRTGDVKARVRTPLQAPR